jgi:hypothetical protein
MVTRIISLRNLTSDPYLARRIVRNHEGPGDCARKIVGPPRPSQPISTAAWGSEGPPNVPFEGWPRCCLDEIRLQQVASLPHPLEGGAEA